MSLNSVGGNAKRTNGRVPKATAEIHSKAFSPTQAKIHYEKALKMFGDNCDGMRTP